MGGRGGSVPGEPITGRCVLADLAHRKHLAEYRAAQNRVWATWHRGVGRRWLCLGSEQAGIGSYRGHSKSLLKDMLIWTQCV